MAESGTDKLFRVPTVPLRIEEKAEWVTSGDWISLKSDGRFQGRIKWYVQPIVFGGDPKPGKNIVWISHEDHIKAVKYWNEMYLHVAGIKK